MWSARTAHRSEPLTRTRELEPAPSSNLNTLLSFRASFGLQFHRRAHVAALLGVKVTAHVAEIIACHRSCLGIERASKLYFETIRERDVAWHMDNWDRLSNLRLKVAAACREVRDNDGLPRQRIGKLTTTDCSKLESAFDSVGLTIRISGAFSRYGHDAGVNQQFTANQGNRLFNDCRITDHTLNVELPVNGLVVHLVSTPRDQAPLTVELPGQEISTRVLRRCGGTPASCDDDQNLEVLFELKTKWAGGGCAYGRANNSLLHRQAFPSVQTLQSEFSHGSHGFRVAKYNDGDPFDYGASLHTWVDGLQFMFARIVYELERPSNVASCDFPGLARVPVGLLSP